jgi:hypothetical protein
VTTPLKQLDGADVLFWAPLDGLTPTGSTAHFRGGQLQPAACALAICRYAKDSGIYLFYCTATWDVQNDTCHDSVEAAKEQAEFEYKGVSSLWKAL